MEISRRSFLKGSLVTVGGTLLPLEVIANQLKQKYPKPVVAEELGNSIPMMCWYSELKKKDFLKIIKVLIADAKRVLPRGSRIEIRASVPCEFGRKPGLAWYHNMNFQKNSGWDNFLVSRLQDSKIDVTRGYALVGRFTV